MTCKTMKFLSQKFLFKGKITQPQPSKIWYTFQCILNVLLERIEPFNTIQGILYVPIVVLESI